MSTKKVVIIDDEAPARNLLKEYLADYKQLQVVAECKNGIEAIGIINVLQPDFIFLDIQMPGKTGFEVLQEVDYIPRVIFSTAYDQFALKAFEVSAVDYLLKPYTKERFMTAVQKVLTNSNDNLKQVQHLTESLSTKTYPERMLVEQGNKLVNITVADVLWIEADGDYTKIHTTSQSFLSNKSMNELEQKLNPQMFQRVHRSAMIALSAIKEVYKEASGPQVVLTNNTVVKVSRTYAEAFKKLMY
jgi:two-component system, LytTR family, response regulator